MGGQGTAEGGYGSLFVSTAVSFTFPQGSSCDYVVYRVVADFLLDCRLEWGRLTDDKRDELGWSGDASQTTQ